MPRKQKVFTPGRGYSKEDWDDVADPHAPTEEQWAQAKPFGEAFPELAAKISETKISETRRQGRGAQKALTKEMISLRVDRDILAAYRATGPGWQARMNEALRAGLRGR